MPTTYSNSLRLALLGNGEDSGTWGQLTNTNLGTLLEQSITGVITVDLSSSNVTLTSYNGVSDQSRNAVIVVTGTQVATNNVIIPNVPKMYLVNNTSSYQIGIQVSGGSTYICPVGMFTQVYCDGAGNVVGITSFNVTSLTVQNALTLIGAGTQLVSTGTGAWQMPVGTTAQRPTGAAGLIRLNSTTSNPEWYDVTTSSWLQFSQPAGYSVNYLVVGGGGGGGGGSGGGGGAGGLITSTTTLSAGVSYTITIGSGGAGGPSTSNGAVGVNSSFSAFATALGGGYGQGNAGGGSGGSGGPGGSGGGGFGGGGGSGTGGSGTGGQGFNGGNGSTQAAGGGGGAGAAAGNASPQNPSPGGSGLGITTSGGLVYYSGGGGGGTLNGVGAAGGLGGGGAGGFTTVGVAGSSNTGGGGGGGGGSSGSYAGGNGGSGIVIIAYFGSQRGTGGTVTSSGGYTIHTFTTSGTYNA